MAVHKKERGYEVYVYDPTIRRKRYVGTRKLKRDAETLFRDKTAEFKTDRAETLTIAEYVTMWLDLHHGPGTTRPEHGTYKVNEQRLRALTGEFGSRLIDGGVGRHEALKWAREHRHHAITAAAMFNDAMNDEKATMNPFANRRHVNSRGRKDIAPITAEELDALAGIALKHWGPDGYGQIARAWTLFAAWIGARPGETFTVPVRNLNFHEGLVTIKRVKKRGGRYPIDTVVMPDDAAKAVRDTMHLLADTGPMFRTVTGKLMTTAKGTLSWHFNPLRAAFRETMTEERWAALIDGQDDFDFYSLRHFCASFIVNAGGNEFDVASQLGNSPQVCRETYIHEYRDKANERNRRLLSRPPAVVDLSERRGA
jgi:integrase